MKVIVILVCCLAAVAVAQEKKGGKKRGPPPGMKCNSTRPEGVTPKDCCPDKPKALSCLARKECSDECKTGEKGKFPDICCLGACTLRNVTTDDQIDVDKVVQALFSQVENNADKWSEENIKQIVSSCLDSAKSDFEKLKERVAAKEAEKSAGESDEKRPECPMKKLLTCSNAELMSTEFCIKKKLFLECPTKVESEKCNQLFEYAKTCPKFWFEHGGRGSGENMMKGGPKGRNNSADAKPAKMTEDKKASEKKGGEKKGAKKDGEQKNQKQADQKNKKQSEQQKKRPEQKNQKQAEKKKQQGGQ